MDPSSSSSVSPDSAQFLSTPIVDPFPVFADPPPMQAQYSVMDQTPDAIPHASVPHTLPPAFSLNTPSSLASALDPAAAVPVGRSRANTLSALPSMHSSSFMASTSAGTYPPFVKQEDPPKERVVGNMLLNIAKVMKTAGDACHQLQAPRSITHGDENKTRHVIAQIHDLITGMGLPTNPELATTSPSRKRHAGEISAEQLPVRKQLKPEPEDINLSALPVPPMSATSIRVPAVSRSQPPSRPPSPPLKSVPSNYRPPPFPPFNIPFELPHRFSHSNRHHHSRSTSSIPREVLGFNASSAPPGRMARNGYFAQEIGSWTPKGITPKSAPTLATFTFPAPVEPSVPLVASLPPTTELVDEEDEEDYDADETEGFSPSGSSHHSYSEGLPSGDGITCASDIPAEYRAEVDRLFLVYLSRICSNLDATDHKGDPIHQQLMAKKMQKLDESSDFRPFKFRIQAFTAAFLEMLAENGYPEEKIPMKKVRNYLWRQPHIQRFNEDGKKAKSKGNHIWNVQAKRTSDGWQFKPFNRQISGSPPPVAYCNMQWTWKPRVWDPHGAMVGVPVQYSSPSLPSWLQWHEGVLSGTPPPNAESLEIVTHAKFTLEGQEGMLTRTFFLSIAPSLAAPTAAGTTDATFGNRPLNPRRAVSDSTLPAWSTPLPPLQPVNDEEDEARVKLVLEQVAERLTQETQPPGHLSMQKTILEQTVNACLDDCQEAEKAPNESHTLAVAGQQVVASAAEYIIVRKQAQGQVVMTSNTSAMQTVNTDELVQTTQQVIAEAVKETTQHSPGAADVEELSILLIACRMLDTALRPQPLPILPPPQVWAEYTQQIPSEWYVLPPQHV
ncbi:hypothetical protein MKEN_01212300 [Mycena kentingensis (nom. inval.)]|nr:hypothetical protein MKEN_01212300 [Mycena kentingensis (nom. inval.)]